MLRFLMALALGACMQAAAAAPTTTPMLGQQAQADAAPGVLQAALVVPAAQAHDRGPAPTAHATATAKDAAAQDTQRPTTSEMLLAALALMTGIALRRWGAGQR